MLNPTARAAITHALKCRQRDLEYEERKLAALMTDVNETTSKISEIRVEIASLKESLA